MEWMVGATLILFSPQLATLKCQPHLTEREKKEFGFPIINSFSKSNNIIIFFSKCGDAQMSLFKEEYTKLKLPSSTEFLFLLMLQV